MLLHNLVREGQEQQQQQGHAVASHHKPLCCCGPVGTCQRCAIASNVYQSRGYVWKLRSSASLAKQTKHSRNNSSVSATGQTSLGQDNTCRERGRRQGAVLQTCWLIAGCRSGIQLPQGLCPCMVRNATVHLHAGWEIKLNITE